MKARDAWIDRALVLGLAAFGTVEVLTGEYDPRAVWVAGAVVYPGLLLWRRTHPLPVIVLMCAMTAGLSAADPDAEPAFEIFALMVAAFSAGAYGSERAAVASVVILLAFWTGGALFDDQTVADVIFVWFVMGGAWLLGRALRHRTAQAQRLADRAALLEEEREARTAAAVAEERARIARELHDVIGHSISVMVLQSGGVRRLLHPDQERERGVLAGVEHTGRQALGELRRLLGLLREAGPSTLEPQPGLARVEELVESVRAAGLDVTLRVEGEARLLSPGLDLSAYRMVQEALTNVLKHARAAHADVLVQFGPAVLELTVTDDGPGPAALNGTGHGLVGMRERAALFGGELEAAGRPEGGFAVRASLPIEPAP